jgi:hypothetical protein
MSDNFSYNLSGGSFLKGWNEVLARISDMKPDAAYACNGCEKRYLCDLCPAFFKWENGAEQTRSEYLCAIGNHRFQKIHNGV